VGKGSTRGEYTKIVAGAMLFDARTMYDQENPKADEVLRGIVESLPEAVGSCVDAAAAELEPIRQSALLKVSSPCKP
jgi:hypothetical protein